MHIWADEARGSGSNPPAPPVFPSAQAGAEAASGAALQTVKLAADHIEAINARDRTLLAPNALVGVG